MERRPSETENKLLLLHAVDCLGAVTAEQLLVFMVETQQMDYVSLQLGLAELDEAGLVRKKSHPLGALYALTGKGRDSLALFEKRVPHSRLQAVVVQAEQWRQRFRREKQMLADFEKTATGDFVVRLRLLEKEASLLDMTLSVPTHEHAQRFCDEWIAQASNIYAHIMHALGEDKATPDNPQ